MTPSQVIYQFVVTLLEIKPKIWRRIQISEESSFWDLHVALQDSMGWCDYHMHSFTLEEGKAPVTIGIPDAMSETIADWERTLASYFHRPGDVCLYEYDFGDGWIHEVLLEGILLKEKRLKYPRCIAGERACPPEDCGGVWGYYGLLEVLADPQHEDYKDMIHWLKNHIKKYHPYNPDVFEPNKVKFRNPREQLETLKANL
jgi:hypothetical protein